MRKALIVGINYYSSIAQLYGCVDDAYSIKSVLERNGDGTVNFDTRILTGTGPTDTVDRQSLRAEIRNLFSSESDIALFYFAGHGHIDSVGGYLVTSDSTSGDDGISLQDIMGFANSSPSRNQIIILDSCHSGIAGQSSMNPLTAELKEGTTILTASTAEQYASEENGGGVFTRLLADALAGAARNLVGEITPGAVYSHIDQSLGAWEQRPVFKTNVKHFVSLRKVEPPIALSELQQISTLFPCPGYEFRLDPSYEPERSPDQSNLPPPDPSKVAVFAVLQKMNRVNLVIPVGAPHMWHAAIQGKSCKLTVLGEHYRRLAQKGRL